MSSFTDPFCTIPTFDGQFVTTRPVTYHVGSYPSIEYVLVPGGRKLDFCSSPKWLRWFVPQRGSHDVCTAIHDELYLAHKTSAGKISRFRADLILLEMLTVLHERNRLPGLPRYKQMAMFIAVRLFGWGHW